MEKTKVAAAVHEHHGDYITHDKSVWSWVTTVDHKRIGIMYGITVAAVFLVAGVLALLVRIELLTPGQTIVGPNTYNQLFSLHGILMVFGFIIPSIPGFLGNFVLPIQIGAKDVAFPRLNLASYYFFIVGMVLVVVAMLIGSVDTGWTFYTPYSKTIGPQILYVTMGVFIAGFASIFTGINIIVTIHKITAPGMTW
ncbi:MAG: cbb3-type cytochrome c oxidase subunit I, partial [Rhodothermales bacterium]